MTANAQSIRLIFSAPDKLIGNVSMCCWAVKWSNIAVSGDAENAQHNFSLKARNTPITLSQINLLCILFEKSTSLYLDRLTNINGPQHGEFRTFSNVCTPSTWKLVNGWLQYFFDKVNARHPATRYDYVVSLGLVGFINKSSRMAQNCRFASPQSTPLDKVAAANEWQEESGIHFLANKLYSRRSAQCFSF